ncbi:MAG: DbpA RNA binding domain-containing protein, partial [Pirellulaceae bacterium]|nr:DbpA RNA binding domain-containing protein [Pirellulaceae bacterium]
RTGRAGRNGEAILFLHPREKTVLNEIEKGTRQSIERYAVPNNRAINKSRVTRFHEKISESLGSREIEKFRTIIEHYENENDVPMENIAAALAVMANGQTSMLVREELKLPDFSEHNSRESVRGRKGGHGQQRHGGRKSESSAARRFARSNSQFESYRIEIGNQDRVQPGNIVGAITNEAGIGNEAIGKIKIFDRYSTVDLPLDISQSAIDHLKGVTVSGRSLNISKLTESDRHSSDRNSRDRNSRDRRPASRMGNKKNDQQKRSSFPKSDNLSNQRGKGRDFKHRGEGTAEAGAAPAKEKGFNPKTSEQKNKFQKSTGSPKKKNFSKPGSFGAKKKFSTKKKSGKPQSSQSSFSPSSRKKNK